MPTFRHMGLVTRPIPGQKGFTETRARGNNGDVSMKNGPTTIQSAHFRRFQEANSVSDSLQIIQEVYRGEMECRLKLLLLHHPGQVRDSRSAVHHRTCHPKACLLDRKADVREKVTHEQLEMRVASARKCF